MYVMIFGRGTQVSNLSASENTSNITLYVIKLIFEFSRSLVLIVDWKVSYDIWNHIFSAGTSSWMEYVKRLPNRYAMLKNYIKILTANVMIVYSFSHNFDLVWVQFKNYHFVYFFLRWSFIILRKKDRVGPKWPFVVNEISYIEKNLFV